MTNIIHKSIKVKILLNRIFNVTSFFMMMTSVSLANSGYTVDEIVDKINGDDGPYKTILQVVGVMSWVGFAVAVLKLVQIGMLFMMSGAKKRNDAKAALFPWALGAVICMMFGTIGPWFIKLLMGDGATGGVFDI